MKIHPDHCKHPDASSAFSHLSELKESYLNGLGYSDEAGPFVVKGQEIIFEGDPTVLAVSLDNYQRLKSRTDSTSCNFHRYMPASMEIKDGKLHAQLEHRAIPLSNIDLGDNAPNHVRWILSRLLEYCMWLESIDVSHAGITPESILVVPETHGIIVASFYHMVPTGAPMRSAAGRYQHWYPASVFSTKCATPGMDIMMAKKLAICLLGDPSGNGVRLKTTHEPHFINFLMENSDDAYETYTRYRELLDSTYGIKYHHLDL